MDAILIWGIYNLTKIDRNVSGNSKPNKAYPREIRTNKFIQKSKDLRSLDPVQDLRF